jgi:hypothetical protein
MPPQKTKARFTSEVAVRLRGEVGNKEGQSYSLPWFVSVP